MQLDLILKIAAHSERAVQRLHSIASFAQYAAKNKNCIIDMHVHCEQFVGCTIYKSFELFHCSKLDEFGHTLPAIIMPSGRKDWYYCGKRHREDCDECGHILPAVIDSNGSKDWYYCGKRHREDCDELGYILPAAIHTNGYKAWIYNGLIHREDCDERGRRLPAVIYADGRKQWYHYGKKINA